MITKYSEISRELSIVIDNFNVHTDSKIILEKIQFVPVYRIFRRDINNNLEYAERFTLNISEACQYWSQLMAEKEFLF